MVMCAMHVFGNFCDFTKLSSMPEDSLLTFHARH